MAFAPRPGDTLSYIDGQLRFVQHPGMKDPFVLREEGKRGTVYQLAKGSEKWALKVFKKLYRKPHQLEIAKKLGPLVGITGMKAAKRTVFEAGHPLVVAHPDLLHAQMMPWVDGFTWFNVLNVGGPRNSTYLQPSHAARLSHRFCLLMCEIERRGIAHTDIASGNVIVDVDSIGVELIDLEEMFGPDFPRPAKLNAGSAGYGHPMLRDPSCDGLWSAECDRFAMAVLLAEMLIFSDPELAAQGDQGGGYFGDTELQSDSPRYRRAVAYLRRECPRVEELFRRAWESPSIAMCASAEDWLRVLEPIVAQAPATTGAGLIPRTSSPHWRLSHAFRAAVATPGGYVAPPPSVEGVTWGPPSWGSQASMTVPDPKSRGSQLHPDVFPESPVVSERASERHSVAAGDGAPAVHGSPAGGEIACPRCGGLRSSIDSGSAPPVCGACDGPIEDRYLSRGAAVHRKELYGVARGVAGSAHLTTRFLWSWMLGLLVMGSLLCAGWWIRRASRARATNAAQMAGYGTNFIQPTEPAAERCVATRHGSFHLRPNMDVAIAGPEYPAWTQVRVFEATGLVRGDERLFRVQVVADGQNGWAFVREDEIGPECGMEIRRPMQTAMCAARCLRVSNVQAGTPAADLCTNQCEGDPTRFSPGL